MTHSSGGFAIDAQYQYDPYGRVTKIAGAGPDADFQYAGYYMHSRSGLNLTRTRAYSAGLGRFISRDPIEESGGSNLYSYVGGNPVNFSDPSGLICGGVACDVGWNPPHYQSPQPGKLAPLPPRKPPLGGKCNKAKGGGGAGGGDGYGMPGSGNGVPPARGGAGGGGGGGLGGGTVFGGGGATPIAIVPTAIGRPNRKTHAECVTCCVNNFAVCMDRCLELGFTFEYCKQQCEPSKTQCLIDCDKDPTSCVPLP